MEIPDSYYKPNDSAAHINSHKFIAHVFSRSKIEVHSELKLMESGEYIHYNTGLPEFIKAIDDEIQHAGEVTTPECTYNPKVAPKHWQTTVIFFVIAFLITVICVGYIFWAAATLKASILAVSIAFILSYVVLVFSAIAFEPTGSKTNYVYRIVPGGSLEFIEKTTTSKKMDASYLKRKLLF